MSTEALSPDPSDVPPGVELPDRYPWDAPGHPLAPYFRDMRNLRRALKQQRPQVLAPPRRAIITMVHNESVFLPLWLGYYGRWFAPEDIYVLDNETSDGSTDRDGFVRIPVVNEFVDHHWMVRTVQELQHDLLGGDYDLVMVTDVDEIIALPPARGDLGTYLDRFDEEFVNCLGYELVHRKDREPALDLSRPLLEQRHWWAPSGIYDKPAITTVPLDWKPGFHGRTDNNTNYDPDVALVHLHRMDYDMCRERHQIRSRKRWADEDADKGWAVHNRITGDDFDRWFYGVSAFGTERAFELHLEQIPAAWRGAF